MSDNSTKKTFPWAPALRALVLFFLAFAITLSVFYLVMLLTQNVSRVNGPGDNPGEFIEDRGSGAGNKAFAEVSSLVKAPISLLFFNGYLLNRYEAKATDSEDRLPVLINVEVNGVYTHQVSYKEVKKIFSSVPGYRISDLTVIRSFDISTGIPRASTTPTKDSFYIIYILPNLWSFFVFFVLLGIPLAYGVLAIVDVCRRFVLYGAPFTSAR